LEQAGASIHTKVASPVAPGGRFTKDAFTIDLQTGTVTCPAQVTISLRQTQHQRHAAVAKFGTACTGCPLAAQCTSSPTGRTITISRHEAQLTRARTAQTDPNWKADYKASRPKVERKIGHLMRRRHGGRRARVRGRTKVAADFSLLAAAVNLARFAVLGLRRGPGQTWVATTI
jgi:DDE family transposase